MKKFILLLALVAGLLSVEAQVKTYTSEGNAYNFQGLITYNGITKAKTTFLTDSTAVPIYDLIYLIR